MKSRKALAIANDMGINCGSCMMETLFSMQIYDKGNPRIPKKDVERFRMLLEGFFEDCPYEDLSSFIDVSRGYKNE